MRLPAMALLSLSLFACAKRPAAAARGDAIAWQSYAGGLAEARSDHKPLLLVISASWCPHCRNYEAVFRDPRVASAARDFVMVRVDEDREPQVAARFQADGAYVPRTFFLAPDGSVEDVHAQNPRYRYFYDERNPTSILAGMSAALALAKAAPR